MRTTVKIKGSPARGEVQGEWEDARGGVPVQLSACQGARISHTNLLSQQQPL